VLANRRLWVLTIPGLGSMVACALGWTLPPADGAGGDAATETSAIDARAVEATAADAAVGAACSSFLGGCPAGEFCHFPDHLCGTGKPGVCIPTSEPGCSDAQAVCSCWGYEPSECHADNNGYDLSVQDCPIAVFLMNGAYQCGWVICTSPAVCVLQTVEGMPHYSCEDAGCTNGCTGCSKPEPDCTCTPISGNGNGAEFYCP
jgi:hypothetical protein